MSKKPMLEEDMESFIIKKTVSATAARIATRSYTDYKFTLIADMDNIGNIYIGKNELGCIFPLDAGDWKDTEIDIGSLFYYSTNGSEILYIWGEKKK